LELEAKVRLNDFFAAAPAVDLRGNASFYRSRVSGVPGPDNRLDQQPGASLNAGADWRWRGTPLAFGGNLAFTPGYSTQLSATQRLEQARTRAFDAYAVWTIDTAWRLRLSASNLLPLDERSVSIVGLQSAETVSTGRTGWQLRLEAKL
jgi:iron complex outermembrane receptor protein